MITTERLQRALTFIAETDEQAATLKTDVERLHYRVKQIKAAIFVHENGSVAMRQAVAEGHTHTETAVAEYLDAYQKSEALQNKRKTEALVIDVWRSLNASKRLGNIT